MKILTALLLGACLSVAGKGNSQTINLSLKQVPVQQVFKAVEQQSNFRFIYSSNILDGTKPITIQVQNSSLENVLHELSSKLPLQFEVEEHFVVVKAKVVTPASKEIIPDIVVTGKVIDAEGQPLSGISIREQGTTNGTQTNRQGIFSLTVQSEQSILVFSAAEFDAETILVGRQRELVINLKQRISQLDETLVVGYGKTTQRFNTGSVTRVSGDDIRRQPVSNPLAALQGRVPGLVITSTSGIPGSTVLAQVRGQNSLNPNPSTVVAPLDNPLIIIDGVPFAPPLAGTNQLRSIASPGNLAQYRNEYGGISPLQAINPYDIESIEVLRDASETAIYGSRGANGVILITTRKGKPGALRVTANVQHGISEATRHLTMMDTEQYLAARKEAFRNDSLQPVLIAGQRGYAPDLLLYDSTRYTDFADFFIGNRAQTTDANVTLSGGSAQTQFKFNAGYHRDTYIFPGDYSGNRASFGNNLHHHSSDHRFQLDFSLQYSYFRTTMVSTPNLFTSLRLPPNYPSLLTPTGDINWFHGNLILTENPLGYLKQRYQSENYTLLQQLSLSYELFKGFQFKTDIGYNTVTSKEQSQSPRSSRPPTSTLRSSASFGTNEFRGWIVEPQVSYQIDRPQWKLSLLAGGTYQQNQSTSLFQQGLGYPDDAFMNSINNAATVTTSDSYTPYKYAGIFGRAHFVWNRQLILQLNGRRDASSRFGADNQFANFGSAGAGWIFTQLPAIRQFAPWLSYGKLRSSYGTTGNDNIGTYEYLARWASAPVTFPGSSVYLPQNHLNPSFGWSVTKKLEAAIELGFLKDRILFTAAWYRNRCDNQLVSYPLPIQTGFAGVVSNFPALVQNSGWELQASAKIIETKEFNWRASVNISVARNVLKAFPGIENSNYVNTYRVGESLSSLRRFVYTGVNPTTGVYEFRTKNGNAYNPVAGVDQEIIGNRDPKFFGGLQQQFTYKGFNLELFFEFRKQYGPTFLEQLSLDLPPGTMRNLPVELLDRWRAPGDIARYQRLTVIESGSPTPATASRNFARSSGAFGDASYIRFKTISLSYSLPSRLLRTLHSQAAQVFINAQNLFTITNYLGHDPETMSYFSVPPTKTIVVGIQFTF